MIEVSNLTVNQINEKFIKKIVKKVFKGENRKEIDLSIVFVGKKRMRELNKKYRKKDRTTDVLAFPESKIILDNFKKEVAEKIFGLGEVVICLDEVKKNAQKYNSSFKKELARVLIHGILHLMGYEHEKNEREAKKMRKKEEIYLSQTDG